MLTVTKNTLLNLTLRLEITLADVLYIPKDKTEMDAFNIINRNIQSIKKQLKKL